MQRLMYGGLDRALVNLTRIYCTAYITTSVWTAYLACLPRYATPLPGCVKYFRQMNNSVGEGDGLSPSLDGEPVVFKCFGEGTRCSRGSKRLWLLSGISQRTEFLKYWNFSDFYCLSEDISSLFLCRRTVGIFDWKIEMYNWNSIGEYLSLYWEDIKKCCTSVYRLHLGKELSD